MNLYDYNEDYYIRKYYIDNDDVPTQTVMRNKMSKLAEVYFKLMPPKIKVHAGLKPSLNGPGRNLYIPPQDMLKGKVALKPVKKENLLKLSCEGIYIMQSKFLKSHQKTMETQKQTAFDESDQKWLEIVKRICAKNLKDLSEQAKINNSVKLKEALKQFEILYVSSINNIEKMLNSAPAEKIELLKEQIHNDKKSEYERSVKQQATTMYDEYEKKLIEQKASLKMCFTQSLENIRTDTATRIHSINLEKHRTVDKLRRLIEYQNLACQVYVTLKERKHCKAESEEIRHAHEKLTSKLAKEITQKELKIKMATEKKQHQQEFIRAWQEKVRQVVKTFQEFVSYSLQTLPEYAEFFINTERLMLLQMNSVIEAPNSESIFEEEEEEIAEEKPTTSSPAPEPFVVFGDLKGDNATKEVQKKMCPDKCVCSLLPVLMINKRCIYAGCDNFQIFRDKIKAFIDGKRGDDIDFADDAIIEDAEHAPIKKSQKTNVESSLTRILKKERQHETPIHCECICRLDACFCSPPHDSDISLPLYRQDPPPSPVRVPSGNKITTKEAKLCHRREPNFETFMKSIVPNECDCVNRLKKDLKDHLPPYMMKTSKYQSLSMPNYELCSIEMLKHTVAKSRGRPRRISEPPQIAIKIEAATQHQDSTLSCHVCDNASEDELEKLIKPKVYQRQRASIFDVPTQLKLVGEPFSLRDSHYLINRKDRFAIERAQSLRRLLETYPSLKNLFDVRDTK